MSCKVAVMVGGFLGFTQSFNYNRAKFINIYKKYADTSDHDMFTEYALINNDTNEPEYEDEVGILKIHIKQFAEFIDMMVALDSYDRQDILDDLNELHLLGNQDDLDYENFDIFLKELQDILDTHNKIVVKLLESYEPFKNVKDFPKLPYFDQMYLKWI